MPLLGLEPPTNEKVGFISTIEEDSNGHDPLAPLLGTKLLKSLSKSSNRRSTQRVCYDSLLRFGAQSQAITSGKTVRNGPRGCYGFSPGLVPKGMFVRGGRFYLRRHIPCDIQSIVGRVEVWRSLKTDSLQSALRRMPSVAAEFEAEFERIRLMAGMPIDPTLLRPSTDDPTPGLFVAPRGDEAVEPHGVGRVEHLTLGEAYSRYMNDSTHRWSASTRQAYETGRRLAVSVIGADLPISAIGRSHCRDYLDVIRHLPRNAAKRFPKLTAREVSQRAREHGGIDGPVERIQQGVGERGAKHVGPEGLE